ncbi:hypothetical protein NC653_023319 [Populus alba x Populus x berolinensis]|uniref:Uncharacterized protein n=1 Tax=Populus alba x Populus x berolinensis TaxID=444605 RepID=A0AAD6MH95_9ROSI|nr:hypothetical protein NC653_023313 [Populus alba x Populus x berolinensis]KAJ6985314.1 hypothetical protein NC653_023319 [Populus alba x Populus x berolinensis]
MKVEEIWEWAKTSRHTTLKMGGYIGFDFVFFFAFVWELNRVSSHLDPFKTAFGRSSSTFEWLSDLLEPLLECRDPIGTTTNLSAELWQGIGLFRLATGSSYIEIADRFGVTESVTRFVPSNCVVFRAPICALGSGSLLPLSLLKEMIADLLQMTRFKMTALLFKLLSIHLQEF